MEAPCDSVEVAEGRGAGDSDDVLELEAVMEALLVVVAVVVETGVLVLVEVGETGSAGTAARLRNSLPAADCRGGREGQGGE